MKKYIFMALFICLNCFAQKTKLDEIAAVVENEIITLSDINSVILQEKAISQEDITKKQALQIMIDESILAQQAKRMNIDITENELSAMVQSFAQSHNQTVESLTAMLHKQNISLEQFKKKLKRQVLSMRVIASLMSSSQRPSIEKVKQYWLEHKYDQIMVAFKDWIISNDANWKDKKPTIVPMTFIKSLPKEYYNKIKTKIYDKEYGPIDMPNGSHMIKVTGWQGEEMPRAYAENVVMMQAIEQERANIVKKVSKNFYIKVK